MIDYSNDKKFITSIKNHLFTAVIGDIMDKMGRYHQFLAPRIRPLDLKMKLAGRAMPVLEADAFLNLSPNKNNPILSKSFGLMLEALDNLQEGDVYICTGASPNYALWGELMSARAIHLKAAGAVVDGYSRDSNGIIDLGFPTFSYGRYAQDQAPRGKVIDYGVPIKMNGVLIEPGDLIIGDDEGVCVVPKSIEKEVIEKAYEKATAEKTVKKAIEAGMSATEAFNTYGIL
jgi:regulator of RNase E activity RraA